MFIAVTEDKSMNMVLINLNEVISFKPTSAGNTANTVIFMKKYGDAQSRYQGNDDIAPAGVTYTFVMDTVEEIDTQLARLDLRER